MSLYNALFGTNPLAPLLMRALDLAPEDCGRFRDCYFEGTPDEPRICVYTRNGGGNRDDHEGVTESLRAHALYAHDEDDSYDSTYAAYYFRVPAPLLGLARELVGETQPPRERWEQLLADMKAGSDTPEVARAMAVGAEIMEKVNAVLDAAAPTAPGRRQGGDAQ